MGHSNDIDKTVANMSPEHRAQLDQAIGGLASNEQQMRQQESAPALDQNESRAVQAARDAERVGDERMQTRTDDLVKGEAQLPEHIEGNLKDYNTQQLDQRAEGPAPSELALQPTPSEPAPQQQQPTPPQKDMEPER